MRCCSVKHCKHLKLDPHTRVYKFPPFDKGHEELKRRRFWMKFTNRPLTMWKPSPGSGICANHFRKKFITIGARNTKLEQTAIPTFPVSLKKVFLRIIVKH